MRARRRAPCAADVRARRGLPVRLKPRDCCDGRGDDDREGRVRSPLPQPHDARAAPIRAKRKRWCSTRTSGRSHSSRARRSRTGCCRRRWTGCGVRLAGSNDGDRQMVKILAAVLSNHSGAPTRSGAVYTPTSLRLRLAPLADCARYDQIMLRTTSAEWTPSASA